MEEEECLGLDVFVAELELVVGNRRPKLDQVALLELLPKLNTTIAKTEKGQLKQLHKRCESAFTELISTGVSAPVGSGGSDSLEIRTK